MLNTISAMTLRQNLGNILNEVSYKHDQVLITRAGKPIAAMIDIDTFNEKIKAPTKIKQQTLEEFLREISIDLSSFKFNRDEANER